MLNKFDRFWTANAEAGMLVQTIEEKFSKHGVFSIDNADIILQVSKLEKVDPALIAVTWMNETTFRFYSEPNKNNQPDNFSAWDVGPMQLNVGYTKKDLEVKFFSIGDVKEALAFGSATDLFDGDPIHNIRLAARKLKALGRALIVGPKGVILFPKMSIPAWNELLEESQRNMRRAIAYTGPDAREARQRSWNKFAPLFTKFFEVYDTQAKETTVLSVHQGLSSTNL